MSEWIYKDKECTAQEARTIIRQARKRTFMLAVHSVQVIDKDKYYLGYGHVEVSRKTLTKKIFHETEGKYGLFSEVVRDKARVKISDTGNILFIG